MSHYFESGFSVREPMWHGLGTILDDYPSSWAEARKLAGLDWEARSRPVLTLRDDLDLVIDPETGAMMVQGSGATDSSVPIAVEDIVAVPEYQCIKRSDTWEMLSIMEDSYGIVPIDLMGRVVELILGQANVKFETAGVLKGGRAVWVLCYIDEPYCVVGDKDATGSDAMTYPYLAVLNSFDGYHQFQVVPTQVRVQCWNTYSAALSGSRSGNAFTFRHSRNVQANVEEAKPIMEMVRKDQQEWLELAGELATLNVNDAAVKRFEELFLPEPSEHGRQTSDIVKANVDKARKMFRELYLGSTCEAHHGTALGLVDASVEYLDHARAGRNSETMFGRSVLKPEPLKAKAVQWARRVATK